MYKLGYDRSGTRLELAQREADVALRLAPGLPQAHLARRVCATTAAAVPRSVGPAQPRLAGRAE